MIFPRPAGDRPGSDPGAPDALTMRRSLVFSGLLVLAATAAVGLGARIVAAGRLEAAQGGGALLVAVFMGLAAWTRNGKERRLRVAAWSMCYLPIFILPVPLLQLGGLHAPPLLLLAAQPTFAAMLLGARAAVGAFVLVALEGLALFVLHLHHYPFPSQYQGMALDAGYLVCLLGSSGLLALMSWRLEHYARRAGERGDSLAKARRSFEQALGDANRFLELLFDSAPLPIVVLDTGGLVTRWNPACQQVFGFSPAEALGQQLPFLPPEGPTFVTDVLAGLPWMGQVIAGRRQDGQDLWVSVSANSLHKDGKLIGLFAILSDVTAQREIERHLATAKANAEQSAASKSLFLANMSHEIRTPLHGLLGMLELLARAEPAIPEANLLAIARRSGDRLSSLLNDILDFSKIEAGRLTFAAAPFDLAALLQDIRTSHGSIRDNHEVAFTLQHLGEVTHLLVGDEGRLRQVLNNLLSNALKFTSRGSICLSVVSQVQARTHCSVSFTVRDTGIGMSPSVVSNLFHPFTQADESTSRRYGGTGLGLSICQRLVEGMGGTLGVSSSEGQGTTFDFTLCLPIVEAPQKVDPNALLTALAQAPAGARPILVAEDNMVNQLLISKQLEKLGYQAKVVGNGAEAVAALCKSPGLFGLVLMDCQMPEVDGYEACRHIRGNADERLRSTPVIAMTAHAMQSDEARCRDAGMDDYVTKPVNLSLLASVLARWIPK